MGDIYLNYMDTDDVPGPRPEGEEEEIFGLVSEDDTDDDDTDKGKAEAKDLAALAKKPAVNPPDMHSQRPHWQRLG